MNATKRIILVLAALALWPIWATSPRYLELGKGQTVDVTGTQFEASGRIDAAAAAARLVYWLAGTAALVAAASIRRSRPAQGVISDPHRIPT